jgi:HD superfamily phosphohydrolase
MEKVLLKEFLPVSDYLLFDDHDVMFHVKQWTRESDQILADLSRRFIQRRLFKAIDLENDREARAAFIERAREQVAALGLDPAYYLIEDRAADIPYYSYYRPEGKARLYIERGGKLCDISEVSNVVRGMRGYELHRLCFPAEALTAISEIK